MAADNGLFKDTYKSVDFFFFENPAKYQCFICYQVSCAPQQLRCCGKIVCATCLRDIRQQQEVGKYNLECPHCRAQGRPEAFPDQMTDRSIKELRVKCPNHEHGCTTVGELADVQAHVKRNCPYQTVKCPLECGGAFRRESLPAHVTHKCYNRKVLCEYCGEEGKHNFITSAAHSDHCQKHPVACPNGCGVTILRQDTATHSEECPDLVVDCPFRGFGCNVRVERKKLPDHTASFSNNHLLLLMQQVMLLTANVEKKDEKIVLLKEQFLLLTANLEKKDKEIASLKEQLVVVSQSMAKAETAADSAAKALQSLQGSVHSLEERTKPSVLSYLTTCKDGGVVVRMDEFEKYRIRSEIWYSEPFYLHPKGYKMCLKVFANGASLHKGSHTSVYLTLMKGKYDDNLKWPLQGNFKVSVLNQLADASHWEKEVKYNLTVPEKATGRVTNGDMATVGHGLPDFLPHNYLGYFPVTPMSPLRLKCYYYNANNTMYFRVQYSYTHEQTLMEPQTSVMSFRSSTQ